MRKNNKNTLLFNFWIPYIRRTSVAFLYIHVFNICGGGETLTEYDNFKVILLQIFARQVLIFELVIYANAFMGKLKIIYANGNFHFISAKIQGYLSVPGNSINFAFLSSLNESTNMLYWNWSHRNHNIHFNP